MGSLSTAFQAEVMTILRSIELLLCKNISALIAEQRWQHLQKPHQIGSGMAEYASARKSK